MGFEILEIFLGIVILLLSLYYYLTYDFNYWEKRNVKGPKPIPIFGNYKDVVLLKKNDASRIKEIWDEFKDEPLIGIYTPNRPKLIVKDLDLVKDVLIKDSNIFCDRSIRLHEKVEPFCLHLLNLEHKRWKPFRTQFTPIFTSARLKDMFHLMTDCADHFQKYVEASIEKSNYVDYRDLTAKFATDSIGVCAFGLNLNAIAEEESEFRKFGKSVFETNFKNKTKRFLREYFPDIYDLIGGFVQPKANRYFEKCIKEIIAYRKENNIKRNDFLDRLIDLKDNSEKIQDFELTDQLLVSQAFVYFIAGFETTSAAISNTLYELAKKPYLQDKLRNEINEGLSKCDGKLTYDCMKNMKFLDQTVKETLRKYPPISLLVRKASSAYKFHGTEVTIPKDTYLIIPVFAIHRDSEIYPNPEEYDPERFNEENEKSRHPMAYLPYGDGPRNCIASLLGTCQVKVGIVAILQKFKVEVCDKTIKEHRLLPQILVAMPIGGIYLKLIKI